MRLIGESTSMVHDRIPYVYRVVTKDGKVYIGSRTAKKCDPKEFWVTYFTSSKIVQRMIKEFGDEYFSVDHLEVFSTVGEAYRVEQERIKALWGTPGLLNRHFQDNDKDIWLTTSLPAEKNPMFGKRGELHHGYGKPGPLKGRKGKEHPMFGKRFPGMNGGERNYWFGKSSPMKGCHPWDNPSTIKYGSREQWKFADSAFECWKAGHGYYRIHKGLGIKIGVSQAMVNKFKSGWNPYEDEAWNNFVKDYT
ncbi:putative endonuclease [Shigella phage ChubbyThor]|nr:putative endonuclease [Shigella phage ChubbyThor]